MVLFAFGPRLLWPLPAALIGMLALAGCGKDDNGKLLASDKIGVSTTEFMLARAHDLDRLCATLRLSVPAAKLIGDAKDAAMRAAFADVDGLATPTTIRRWDYVLLRDQHDPRSYEAIFIDEWRPPPGSRDPAPQDVVVLTPLRCVITKADIKLFELEPPSLSKAGDDPPANAAAIVAKYSRVPGDVAARRIQEFAKSYQPGGEEVARIIRESDGARQDAATGSSRRE